MLDTTVLVLVQYLAAIGRCAWPIAYIWRYPEVLYPEEAGREAKYHTTTLAECDVTDVTRSPHTRANAARSQRERASVDLKHF